MRVQGRHLWVGAYISCLIRHFGSGVLRAETVPFSAVMIRAIVTRYVVGRPSDGQDFDQASFKKTRGPLVICYCGANLVRRGLYLASA